MKAKWTSVEEQFLADSIKDGKTCKEVAEKLGRTTKSVQHRFNQMGLSKSNLVVGNRIQTFTITELYSINTGKQNKTMAKYICDCGRTEESLMIP